MEKNETERINFRSGVFQLLSNAIIMPNNESNGKKRSSRYKSWNPTIAILYNGSMVLGVREFNTHFSF